ncbi:MAG: recombinase family protein [Cyanobacteriota bacterium]|nr:recombinase family protein [Cyanobacteriota bacterium]
MQIIAYLYSDPLLDAPPSPEIWGLEIDRVYEDRGQRQQLQHLLADCKTRPPAYLLVRRLEELGDSLNAVESAIEFLEGLGIEIIATEQNYSTSQLQNADATDLRAHLSQLLQEIEQTQRRRRLSRGHARNRIAALPPPGKACYGYRRGKDRYILDRSTAPAIKDFFDRYLLFGSLRGAVRYLEQKYGKKISVTTGRRWLTNPVYRGDLAYQTGEIIPDTHAPILSRSEAAQIDRLLRRNRRLPPRTASAPRSLAGLVVCQRCQSPMTIARVAARGKSPEYLYLRPIRCSEKPKCKALPYEQVLEQTIARICEDLPPAVAATHPPNLSSVKDTLMEEVAKKEEILTQIPGLREREVLDEETANLRTYNLRAEIARVRDKLAQLPPTNLQAIAQTVALPQFWFDLSETERRFYFREFIQRVEIVRHDRDWSLQLLFIF